MLLMGVPHHRCMLQYWLHKALVLEAVCVDFSWVLLQVPIYVKALTMLAFGAADWMYFSQWQFSVNSAQRYFALVTL